MKILSSSMIGDALRQVRLDLGIRQKDLADMIKIPDTSLNKVEAGRLGFDTAWLKLMPCDMALIMKDALKVVLIKEIEEAIG